MSPDTRALCLLLRVGGRLSALPLEHVDETMRPQPVQPIAGAPDYVSGVAVIRGVPIPVVDAASLLDKPNGSAAPTRFVVVRTDHRRVALAVEQVIGVTDIPQADLSAMPALLRGTSEHVVSAIATVDRELLLVLRSSRFVPEGTWSALDAGAVP